MTHSTEREIPIAEQTAALERERARARATIPRTPEILTVDEAADLLRVDRKTVYSLIRTRTLPGVWRDAKGIAIKPIRIHRGRLLEWMAAG